MWLLDSPDLDWSVISEVLSLPDLFSIDPDILFAVPVYVGWSSEGKSSCANRGKRTWIPPMELSVECTECVIIALTS